MLSVSGLRGARFMVAAGGSAGTGVAVMLEAIAKPWRGNGIWSRKCHYCFQQGSMRGLMVTCSWMRAHRVVPDDKTVQLSTLHRSVQEY